jgi:putative flippase GtrA
MIQQWVQWVAEPVENVLLQVPRALAVSTLAAALDFGCLVMLVEGAGWNPLVAATVSYLLGGIVQYVLCAVWVFPAAPESVPIGFAVFTVLSLGGLVITWGVMAGLHDLANANYAFAKVVSLGLAFSWNFLTRKYWLFSPASNTAPVKVD